MVQVALAELRGIRGAEQQFARRGMRLEELPRARRCGLEFLPGRDTRGSGWSMSAMNLSR
jgi:hypothetical protein